jgi:predicted house-cleaning noncanonical NTP pyrophosphatase (MazG superfamily)
MYKKLVRDRIPEIILSKGETPITRILSDAEYKEELEKKLHEEYLEVLDAAGDSRIEELADMLEVMEALASVENKTLEDVLSVKAKKQEKRGAFKDKIYLEGVE